MCNDDIRNYNSKISDLGILHIIQYMLTTTTTTNKQTNNKCCGMYVVFSTLKKNEEKSISTADTASS